MVLAGLKNSINDFAANMTHICCYFRLNLICACRCWGELDVFNTKLKPFIIKTSLFDFKTSSAAQGGGGNFKNRKPIGEIGCCESGMAERSH